MQAFLAAFLSAPSLGGNRLQQIGMRPDHSASPLSIKLQGGLRGNRQRIPAEGVSTRGNFTIDLTPLLDQELMRIRDSEEIRHYEVSP